MQIPLEADAGPPSSSALMCAPTRSFPSGRLLNAQRYP